MKYIFLFLFFIILFFISFYILYEYTKYTIINKKIHLYQNYHEIINTKYLNNNIYLNKLPDNIKYFYQNLEKYLNLNIYFYGSILRDDFNLKYSDLDTCLFIKNNDKHENIIDKILYYLTTNHIQDNNNIIIRIFETTLQLKNFTYHGFLINYKSDKLRTDFLIYSEEYKKNILLNNIQKSHTIHPIQVYILKHLKYFTNELKIISIDNYNYIKNEILSIGYENIYNAFNKEKIKEITL
jgi:hypothetical protein